MSYSLIPVWQVYEMDSGYMFFTRHIAYCLSAERAAELAGTHYVVDKKQGIQIDSEIFILEKAANNSPIAPS